VLAYVALAGGDGLKVRLALAGHPPALIVRRDGSVEAIGAPGTMLGVQPDPLFSEADVALSPGDVLVLYTDGVTEAGPRHAPLGEHGLETLLGTLVGRDPQDVVEAVEAAVLAAQEGEPRDDIAVLALALPAP